MQIIIYRYEYPNGDGPFFTKDGLSHVYPDVKFNDDTLSGCGNIIILEERFRKRNIPTRDFIVRKYKGEYLHQFPGGEILIRKSSAHPLLDF